MTTPLFLDGLDESRIGTFDDRTPLDQIRGKLDRLGRPPFRLSCRWAEWLGAIDKERLTEVSADGAVTAIRLDPLTQQNIKEILAKNHGVADTDGFIAAANARGIDGLLRNPQTLDLLAESVSQGQWPNSRKETFEQACRVLARERNKEHLQANPLSRDTGRLIEAAGRLCAVQVLTGIAGYTLPDRATPDSDYPSLEEIDGEVEDHTRGALGTKLFIGVSEGKFAPVHRQIAEFLAAQHIARLIDRGLSLQRVVALITGFDGELLQTFWNFSSWLAVHSKSSRRRLSQLNPSGMIYQGDKQTYSVDEKRDILLKLRQEANWNPSCLRSISWPSGIGNIVTLDIEDIFRELFSHPERRHDHQSYVMTLLQMLADGEPLSALLPLLKAIAYDSTWNLGVRGAALDVLVVYNKAGHVESDVLVNILADVADGTVDDPVDELLGILLKSLYPGALSTTEILKHLKRPKDVSRIGEYTTFWTQNVPQTSTPNQIAHLLDRIAAGFKDYRPFMVGDVGLYTTMGHLPLLLLDRIIEKSKDDFPLGRPFIIEGSVDVPVNHPPNISGFVDGIPVERLPRVRPPLDDIPAERLSDWLLVASDPGIRAPESLTTALRFGLEWNADKLKELTADGVKRCLATADAFQCMGIIARHLFGARPFDYGPWCLEEAVAAQDERAAAFYLGEVLTCVADQWNAGGLTVDNVRQRLGDNASLLALFDQGIEQKDSRVRQMAIARKHESRNDTDDQLAWQRQVEDQAQDLVAGRGEPRLLHQVAEVYFGVAEDVKGTTPSERLANLVGSRADLVAILHKGLETVLKRADLPDCRGVVRLFDMERTDFLVLPLIAGLDSRERSGLLIVEKLGEEQIRLAVTVLYTLPGRYFSPEPPNEVVLYRPEWFRAVLRNNPVLVADVLCQCVEDKLRTAKQPAVELYQLAFDDGHSQVARLASLPLLELFPNTDTVQARRELGWLLKAALNNCERSQVRDVVKKRIAKVDLVSGQKIYWLTAGYFVMPDLCREGIKVLSTESDAVLRGVWQFFAEGRISNRARTTVRRR